MVEMSTYGSGEGYPRATGGTYSTGGRSPSRAAREGEAQLAARLHLRLETSRMSLLVLVQRTALVQHRSRRAASRPCLTNTVLNRAFTKSATARNAQVNSVVDTGRDQSAYL